MDPKPFLHQHYLIFDDNFPKQVECCDTCNNQIEGSALCCKSCNFWLHDTCARQKLPSKFLHPFHSHLLTLFPISGTFLCDGCVTLSSGIQYRCNDCSFNLDLMCASSTTELASKRSKDVGKKMKHFSHRHSLTLFFYRQVNIDGCCCSWCGMPLSGMPYGCISCHYVLHKSCLSKIPTKILSHPFHPSHPICMYNEGRYSSNIRWICCACGQLGVHYEALYRCQSGCKYRWFHIACINLKPTLKHDCHHHSLSYFLVTRYIDRIKCNKCGLGHKMRHGDAFYGCVQCEFKVFLECLIASSIEHKYHRHSLTLDRGFKEDISEEHYCDICEEQRNLRHHVYCCKQCMFVAHIECALDMFDHGSGYDSWKHEELKQSDAKFLIDGQIDYFDHHHLLSFNERIGKNDCFCNACEQNICEEAGYLCESCQNYVLHKACAELPKELLHPLHSHHPPLTLLNIQGLFPTVAICDKCREIVYGFVYMCFDCDFKLDIKCATTLSVINEKQELRNQIEIPQAKSLHFSHHHELAFGYCNSPYRQKINIYCSACNSSIISGAAYFCMECTFCLHESCLSKLPKNIQIPYHPHPLYPSFQEDSSYRTNCRLCNKSDMNSLRYRSDAFSIHYRCASSLMHPLKSKHHSHDLYFLHKSIPNSVYGESCGRCNELCGKDESIFRCIKCQISFHTTCVGIPSKVKSKYHVHPFILQDHFIEDDSGDYYCDICEEERNPNLAVYSCEECQGRFIAHIECVLREDGIIEEVVNTTSDSDIFTAVW